MRCCRARVSPSGEGSVGCGSAEPTAGATRARLSCPLLERPEHSNGLVSRCGRSSTRCEETHGNPRSPYFGSYFGAESLVRETTGALHPHLEAGKVRDIY